jgi:hypothetical protein
LNLLGSIAEKNAQIATDPMSNDFLQRARFDEKDMEGVSWPAGTFDTMNARGGCGARPA